MRFRLDRRHVAALLFGAAAVAVVTGVVFALRHHAPVVSLGVLYLFAVLPTAVWFGAAWAAVVSVASMLAFNWFFLPPLHTFALRDSGSWISLVVYLATAFVVSAFAARARQRATDAEERRREASLLADVSGVLLEAEFVQSALREVAALTATALGTRSAWIELDSRRRPDPGQRPFDLEAPGRHVGRLFLPAGTAPRAAVLERVLPALATLLAVAREREQMRARAVETETLRRSDAVKTALLRAVSHDLRSPLTAIITAVEGLRDDRLVLSDADRLALHEAISGEARRLDRLVGNLLDLSRLEAGSAQPRPEIWTVDGLLARALGALDADVDRVHVSIPADASPVRVDGAHAERILVNLLENALAYSSPGEPVEVTAREESGEVVTRVRDHGPGLSPAELRRVFDAFERGVAGAERGGTGLGLAIAQGFAQANGGRVFAEPVEGGGTAFALALPAVPAPVRART
jgi:two-component system sensor histidine kinase KdpD